MDEEQPVKAVKFGLALAGFILGAMALLFSAAGDQLTLMIFSEPPPSVLRRADSSDATADDVTDAVSDYALHVVDRASDKLRRKGYIDDEDERVRSYYRRGKRRLKRLLELDDEPAPRRASAAGDREAPAPDPDSGPGPESDAAPPRAERRWEGWGSRFSVDFSRRTDRQKTLRKIFSVSATLGGVAAVILSLAGWVRREDWRMASAAGLLGFVGMVWSYLAYVIASLVYG